MIDTEREGTKGKNERKDRRKEIESKKERKKDRKKERKDMGAGKERMRRYVA